MTDSNSEFEIAGEESHPVRGAVITDPSGAPDAENVTDSIGADSLSLSLADIEGFGGRVVTARGTEEGLVLRIDGRAEWSVICQELNQFLGGRRRFLEGGEIAIEWLDRLPTVEQGRDLEEYLRSDYRIEVITRRKRSFSPLGRRERLPGGEGVVEGAVMEDRGGDLGPEGLCSEGAFSLAGDYDQPSIENVSASTEGGGEGPYVGGELPRAGESFADNIAGAADRPVAQESTIRGRSPRRGEGSEPGSRVGLVEGIRKVGFFGRKTRRNDERRNDERRYDEIRPAEIRPDEMRPDELRAEHQESVRSAVRGGREISAKSSLLRGEIQDLNAVDRRYDQLDMREDTSLALGRAESDALLRSLRDDWMIDEEANAKIVFATLRSGQKVETPYSLIVVGDVNPGADLIAGGDIIIVGSLRGTAHASAYDFESFDRVIIALQMRPMQLRIGSIISRGSDEVVDGAEIARIDNRRIVVEAFNPRGNFGFGRRQR